MKNIYIESLDNGFIKLKNRYIRIKKDCILKMDLSDESFVCFDVLYECGSTSVLLDFEYDFFKVDYPNSIIKINEENYILNLQKKSEIINTTILSRYTVDNYSIEVVRGVRSEILVYLSGKLIDGFSLMENVKKSELVYSSKNFIVLKLDFDSSKRCLLNYNLDKQRLENKLLFDTLEETDNEVLALKKAVDVLGNGKVLKLSFKDEFSSEEYFVEMCKEQFELQEEVVLLAFCEAVKEGNKKLVSSVLTDSLKSIINLETIKQYFGDFVKVYPKDKFEVYLVYRQTDTVFLSKKVTATFEDGKIENIVI